MEADAGYDDDTRDLLRDDLIEWTHEFCTSPDPYTPGEFHRRLCADLEWWRDEVEAGNSPQLMVFAPPRHGKSEHSTIQLPAQMLCRRPDRSIIVCSHTDSWALGYASDHVRSIVRDPRFRELGGSTIRPNKGGIQGWEFPEGGGLRAIGVDSGRAMGRGAHALIFDDLYPDGEAAESAAHRDKVLRKVRGLHTRLAPGGGVLYLLHRWRDDDVCGSMLELAEQGVIPPFRVVSYPAIATRDEGWRKEGDALWPEVWSLDHLELRRGAAGPASWNALYQQTPDVRGGETVQARHLLACDLVYSDLRDPGSPVDAVTWEGVTRQVSTASSIVITVDAAKSKTAISDRCAIQAWPAWGGDLAIVEAVAEVMDFAGLCARVEEMAGRYPGAEIVIESEAWGPAAAVLLRERNVPRVHLWNPQRWGSKAQRVGIAANYIRPGHVRVPTEDAHLRPWVARTKAEWVRYPKSKHDDAVDAMSMAVIWHVRISSGRAAGPPLVGQPQVIPRAGIF
jgi:phage terminase large subunit-like protein